MKFIVLVLLLPVLVTSTYLKRPNPTYALWNFEYQFQQLLKKKDFNALAKYISDDFQYIQHGREHEIYVKGKQQFLNGLERSQYNIFEGKMNAYYGPEGKLIVTYEVRGVNKLILSPNAALKAGYELVKFEVPYHDP